METTGSDRAVRARRDVRTGVVEAVSGAKSVRVVLENLVRHPVYGKYLRRRTRLLVHDEQGQARAGDTVEIASCRPLSRRKAWRLLRVVRKARMVHTAGV